MNPSLCRPGRPAGRAGWWVGVAWLGGAVWGLGGGVQFVGWVWLVGWGSVGVRGDGWPAWCLRAGVLRVWGSGVW